MALVSGTIVGTGQAIIVELPTARIPELPAIASISPTDRFPLWDAAGNLTGYMTPQQMREFVGGTPVEAPPVLSGSYLEIEIPSSLYGQTTMPVPALAGKNYNLQRVNKGWMWSTWFNTLSTGGFQLTRAGDVFFQGDKFVAHLYEMEGGDGGPGGGTGGGTVDRGFKLIDGSYDITPADFGYRFKISAGSNKPIIRLPALADVPNNTEIPLLTIIGNDYQATIETRNGEFIYIGNEARTTEYMGMGESLRLKKDADGWYAIEGTSGNYTDAGWPIHGYQILPNTIVADGQVRNRDSYPRLWRAVQTMGPSLIADSLWESDAAYQGCYSTGDGTTTFRVPNLRGTTLRMLDLGRGFDTNGRAYDHPGGYQPDKVGKLNDPDGYNDLLKRATTDGTVTGFDPPSGPNQPDLRSSKSITELGANENTMKNTGVLGLIKI